MFSLISGLYAEYFSPQQINLLVVGVQGCGKTTILERIKVTNFATESVTTITGSMNHNGNIDDTVIAAAAAAAAVTSKTRDTTIVTGNMNGTMHHSRRNVVAGPTPELLRSKIFLTDTTDDYQAPAKRRNRHNNQLTGAVTSSSHQPPFSRFGWICPPAPKFIRNSRLDISDRSSSNFRNINYNDDDEFSTDAFENNENNEIWENMDDDDNEDDDLDHTMDTTLLSTTSKASARSRRSAASSSHNISNASLTSSKHGAGPVGLPAPRRITSLMSSQHNDDLRKSSMESIDLEDKQRWSSHNITDPLHKQQRSFLLDEEDDGHILPSYQHDVKPGAKMLPLERIRPTIGMNLGKTEICGAKVHVWDLGGKLHDLWERYYEDADAVLFVWRLNRNDVTRQESEQSTNDNDDDIVRVTAEQQMRVLEEVRSAVPDDVPFCLLGHLFQIQPPYNCEPDVLYSTSQLLPHYHNPLQALFMANAVSGQGIKSALEWLISTAKRQQRIRKRTDR